MRQPDSEHVTWIYMEDDLYVGSGFTLQFAPEIDDNIFLYKTVATIDATASTPTDTFTKAVEMDYLVDFGWMDAITEDGEVIGTFHAGHPGRVFYVPDIGPVDLYGFGAQGGEASPPPGCVRCLDQ